MKASWTMINDFIQHCKLIKLKISNVLGENDNVKWRLEIMAFQTINQMKSYPIARKVV